MVPIEKGGDLSLPNNWRPVCKQSCLSKVLEKIICNQLSYYLTSHLYLPPSQHAYKPKRSTTTALIDLDTFVTRARNEGKCSMLVNTDQSGAFNVIPHQILIQKLRKMNVGELSLKFLSTYLGGRTNKTCVGGFISSQVEVPDGMPEGSILGPLLYSVGQVDVGVCAERAHQRVGELHHVHDQQNV